MEFKTFVILLESLLIVTMMLGLCIAIFAGMIYYFNEQECGSSYVSSQFKHKKKIIDPKPHEFVSQCDVNYTTGKAGDNDKKNKNASENTKNGSSELGDVAISPTDHFTNLKILYMEATDPAEDVPGDIAHLCKREPNVVTCTENDVKMGLACLHPRELTKNTGKRGTEADNAYNEPFTDNHDTKKMQLKGKDVHKPRRDGYNCFKSYTQRVGCESITKVPSGLFTTNWREDGMCCNDLYQQEQIENQHLSSLNHYLRRDILEKAKITDEDIKKYEYCVHNNQDNSITSEIRSEYETNKSGVNIKDAYNEDKYNGNSEIITAKQVLSNAYAVNKVINDAQIYIEHEGGQAQQNATEFVNIESKKIVETAVMDPPATGCQYSKDKNNSETVGQEMETPCSTINPERDKSHGMVSSDLSVCSGMVCGEAVGKNYAQTEDDEKETTTQNESTLQDESINQTCKPDTAKDDDFEILYYQKGEADFVTSQNPSDSTGPIKTEEHKIEPKMESEEEQFVALEPEVDELLSPV